MAASKSNLVALATLSLLFASCAADYSTPTGGYAGGYSQSLANGQVAEGSTAAWTQAEGLDDANAYALLTAYAMTDNPFGDAEALSVSGGKYVHSLSLSLTLFLSLFSPCDDDYNARISHSSECFF